MKISITSTFPANFEIIFQKVTETKTLFEIAKPILYFKPINPNIAPKIWEIDRTYIFSLKLFNIIPLGKHKIRVTTIDKRQGLIKTHETGKIAKIWNHDVILQSITEGSTLYTDKIEIKTGILTLFIWIFANFFGSRLARISMILYNYASKSQN